jgi:O-antigen ligase
MTGLLALGGVVIAIAWLLRRDARERIGVSPATWLVVAWIVIHGTRPVTSWFATTEHPLLPQSYDEGNAVEALVNLGLIVGGLLVLGGRRVRLAEVIKANRVLMIVYLFWLLSMLWSDYPVITLKRWIKDVGNIVMALVVLSGWDPGETIRAICVRCAYVVIPLSAVLIRFYPGVGRAYVGYDSSERMYVGVTANKNALGVLVFVLALFVLWDVLEVRRRRRAGMSVLAARAAVLVMCWYLLIVADSVTSLIGAAIGSALLLVFGISWIKRRPARLEMLAVSAVMLLLVLDWAVDVRETLIRSLGRDLTLTTRTEVWPLLMRYQENPLLGAGFNSFWAGERLMLSYERLGGIIQAHNGYLETYLNGGWLGVGLLLALVAASYWRIRISLRQGQGEAAMRFVILVVAIIYNYSEASFFKVGPLWLVTILAMMEYRARARPVMERVPVVTPYAYVRRGC